MRIFIPLALIALAACDRGTPPPTPVPAPSPVPPPPPPPVRKRVALEVKASTWREKEAPFDVAADLKPRLRAGGIEVVDGGSDGTLRVDYTESRGREFQDTFNHIVGHGTDIELTIAVREFTLTIKAATPYATTKGLYESAIDALKAVGAYERIGHVVAVALGVDESLPELLPLLRDFWRRDPIAELLAARSYSPPRTVDRVHLLLALKKPEDCVAIGREAVEPMLEDFNRGWVPEYEERLARALGRLGDPRPARALLDKAKERAPFAFADRLLVVALIEAVGLTGDASMLAEIDALAKHEETAVAEAARAARAAIERRK